MTRKKVVIVLNLRWYLPFLEGQANENDVMALIDRVKKEVEKEAQERGLECNVLVLTLSRESISYLETVLAESQDEERSSILIQAKRGPFAVLVDRKAPSSRTLSWVRAAINRTSPVKEAAPKPQNPCEDCSRFGDNGDHCVSCRG
jgi:hypothetical protein